MCFGIFNMVLSLLFILFIPCFSYVDWMAFYGLVGGACHHTLNIALVAWVLYSLAHDLLVQERSILVRLPTTLPSVRK